MPPVPEQRPGAGSNYCCRAGGKVARELVEIGRELFLFFSLFSGKITEMVLTFRLNHFIIISNRFSNLLDKPQTSDTKITWKGER